ncbi:hypothetical protein AX769_19735 [Frondihabitans sp. PAMC 28766]|nr:hypothetical protein [Frondihabitans sp. PAMC 28766]AMM21967.1 hypothetical protein AX769_19735 [Frondihabitans sp. PAMC 28766]
MSFAPMPRPRWPSTTITRFISHSPRRSRTAAWASGVPSVSTMRIVSSTEAGSTAKAAARRS